MAQTAVAASTGKFTSLEGTLVRKLDISEADNKRFIAGYANIAGIVDSQNEVLTREALEAAWEKFKKSPDFAMCQLMHGNIPIAKIIFEPVVDSKGKVHQSGVDERGLYIVAQVRDDVSIADDVWKRIERGEIRGFSIGGRNLEPQAETCEGDRCFRFIKNLELYEVSIVDRPANRVSLFNILKCDKEMRDDLLKLSEATKAFSETVLIEGVVKVSKTPNPDGKYDLYACVERGSRLCKELSQYLATREGLLDRFTVVEEMNPDREYINLLDLSLLRPFSLGEGLTAEERHVGPNPPLLEDRPQEGETPMEKEEVKEERVQDSEESEPSEASPVESEKVEDTEEKAEEEASPAQDTQENSEESSEEAVAPMTIEVLAADVARLLELFDKYVDKAVWSRAYINDLPDSAFAYIEPGGKKDEEGKTTPRSLRHLPYKDKEGKIDPAHVRNALARLPQTHISAEAKAAAKKKLLAAARKVGIEVAEKAETEKIEKSEIPAEAKAEEKKEERVQTVEAPKAAEAKPEVKPEAKAEEAKPQEKPVQEAKTEPVIETRGQSSAATESPQGFDILSIYKMPWKKLTELDELHR